MAENYPIQRLVVYNVVPGKTHVTWDIHPNMKDPNPETWQYTLQVNRLPNPNDGEWVTVDGPETNVFQLEDTSTASNGFKLDKYYRVILKTSRGEYTSPIEGCFGQLHRYEWKLVQEIIRKENLRNNNVSIPCVLLKVRTSGEKCPHCTDGVIGGSNNSECEYCYGTGYLGGYYTPYPFSMVEISPTQLMEKHESDNVTTLNISDNRYDGRSLGIPEIVTDDVIVDLSTSQRFRVQGSQSISQLRRVPIARKLDMILLPWSNPVYKVPVGVSEYTTTKEVPTEGCGYKLVDDSYMVSTGGTAKTNMVYQTAEGMPISGATIDIYNSSSEKVFTTTTDTQGKWNKGYMASLGTYTVKFYKPGFYTESVVSFTIASYSDELTSEEKVKYNQDKDVESTDYTQHFF